MTKKEAELKAKKHKGLIGQKFEHIGNTIKHKCIIVQTVNAQQLTNSNIWEVYVSFPNGERTRTEPIDLFFGIYKLIKSMP